MSSTHRLETGQPALNAVKSPITEVMLKQGAFEDNSVVSVVDFDAFSDQVHLLILAFPKVSHLTHNAMRVVFQQKDWARRLTALDVQGLAKTGSDVSQDVAGSTCFAGDFVGHERGLPLLEPSDLVLLPDTGGYCFSNHFEYNAMQPEPVFGESIISGEVKLSTISKGQGTQALGEVFS